MTEEGESKSDNEKNVSKELAREFRWVEFAQIASNVTLAVVGIIALCIYNGQLKEMRKSTKAAQDAADAAKSAADTAAQTLRENGSQFRIEERPYVSIENMRFDPPLEQSHEPATIKLDFHNAGHTPALKATFTVDVFVDNKRTAQLPRDFAAELTIPSDRNSASSVNIWIRGPGDYDGIVAGTRRISIKGEITYFDIFQESHPTTFCAVYDAKVTKQWVFCPGNGIR